VTDDDLAILYSSAAAFVYPSVYEGFGIPLLEAMACGTPVVASLIPSSLEIAGSVPYYFPPNDHRRLMQALNYAISRKNWMQRVKKASRILRHYSWDKSVCQTVSAYRSLVK